jgi:hypothetical protein
MRRSHIRWIVLLALIAFLPLIYYLAVVGGLLPYGAILLIAIRNIDNSSILLFSLVHLVVYGLVLYWSADVIARLIIRVAGSHVVLATLSVILLLASMGLLPVFGVAHGQIAWISAYALYASDKLR